MHLLAIDPALQMATFSPCAHMTERERERRERRERERDRDGERERGEVSAPRLFL